ncbi:MAG: hypothetical protein SFU87_01535 [Chitinophagaceae bacterium]|nr:hypothetical protein [Chitinophagaceae bacterium]
MKKPNRNTIQWLLVISLSIAGIPMYPQDSAGVPDISLAYYAPHNNIPYVIINTRMKIGKKFSVVAGVPVTIYLNEAVTDNLMAKLTTDESGRAKAVIPAILKPVWDSSDGLKFLAVSGADRKFPETNAELTIKKARLEIDTASEEGMKSITAKLLEKNGNEWTPVKDAEMKIAVKRLLGDLSAGDEETYTSDSTGMAAAEFIRDSLPGDKNGNIIITAKTEDHDTYGNLAVEKIVPWGVAHVNENTFGKRTLWGTRDKTPLWLLGLASFIVIVVWSVIIFLVVQIRKIRAIGRKNNVAVQS